VLAADRGDVTCNILLPAMTSTHAAIDTALSPAAVAFGLGRGGILFSAEHSLAPAQADALGRLLCSGNYQQALEDEKVRPGSLGRLIDESAAAGVFVQFAAELAPIANVDDVLAASGSRYASLRATDASRVRNAVTRLTALTTGFIPAMAFKTAVVQLDLFNLLADGPLPAGTIAEARGVKAASLTVMLDALVAFGLLDKDKEGRYGLSELGRNLTSNAPVPLAPIAAWVHQFYDLHRFMFEAVRDHEPQYQAAFGKTSEAIWEEHIYCNPIEMRRFQSFMEAFAIPIGQEIAERVDFSASSHVLDVAGGTGALSLEILRRHPHLRGTVMDLPNVRDLAQERIRQLGLADRAVAVPGDLFTGPYPPGADVITLSWILHDWSDAAARQTLSNCHRALPSGGRLLISEIVLKDDDPPSPFQAVMKLQMLLACAPGARERTESEYRGLLTDAAFADVEVIRLEGLRDLIVARKP
jgi:ubiquinone/menaquinone biosynthesis C-methylase UbiE